MVVVERRESLRKEMDDRYSGLLERVATVEKEVEWLKSDTTGDQLLNLVSRVNVIEQTNHQQENKLTTAEFRLKELEQKTSDPAARIVALEQKFDALVIMVNSKAEYGSLKALEESYVRVNELLNAIEEKFADKQENEDAHSLLLKNLKI